MSYVVPPSFDVAEDNLDDFLAAGSADAEQSVATEPGCLQFDIVIDREVRPIQVVFYEVYADRAAFEAHLKTPHLAAFRESLHLCVEGPVRFFERLVP
jgi:quinol monooxygenase YgiN